MLAAPLKVRLSLTSALHSTKGKAAQKLKELLESSTKGEMTLEVSYEGKLYKDREELDALQLGAVEMIIPSHTKFVAVGVKEFSLFAFPYLFKDLNDVHLITDGPVGQLLSGRLEPKGIKVLGYWDLGFNHFHSNRPIYDPSQTPGLKVKSVKSRVLDSVARALQTIPVVLPRSDALGAYKSGEVNASGSPLANFYSDRFYEVQTHITLTSHSFHGYVVAVSLVFWNSLTPTQQSQLQAAVKAATQFERELANQENLRVLEELKKGGKVEVHTPSPQEMALWKKALIPVQGKFKREPEGAYIQQVQDTLGVIR